MIKCTEIRPVLRSSRSEVVGDSGSRCRSCTPSLCRYIADDGRATTERKKQRPFVLPSAQFETSPPQHSTEFEQIRANSTCDT